MASNVEIERQKLMLNAASKPNQADLDQLHESVMLENENRLQLLHNTYGQEISQLKEVIKHIED